MKIIIAGDGKVGATLTGQLSSEGHDIVLVDSDRDVLNLSVERYDVMAVYGNCASMEVLMQAGVSEAQLLIAATTADETNLLCCMTAHGINPSLHTIARVRNPEYSKQLYSMKNVFNLSMVVNPERQAAVEMERLLKYPGFLKRDTFVKGRVEIVELRIDSESKLCNVQLSELNNIVKCKVLICTVLRDGNAFTPDGNFVLRDGDRIFVTAPSSAFTTLLKNLGIITHKVKKVMIAGGGRISVYLAQLLGRSGVSVEIIEKDADRCRLLAELLPDSSIIHGDASDQMLLRGERIESYDALVTATGMDELNMIVSLYGKTQGLPQIITKLSHMANAEILGNLFAGSIICPRELCCNSLVRYVRAMQNQETAAITVHSIADGKVEATEFLVDDNTQHVGEKLKDIKLRSGVLIASISRGMLIDIPDGESSFLVGDSLVIVTNPGIVIGNLNEIFASDKS